MAQNFFELAFTPTIKAEQEKHGSRQQYERLSVESVLIRLRDAVSRREQRLDELRLHLEGAVQWRLRVSAQRLAPLIDRLRRKNPAARLVVTHRRLQSVTQRLHRMTSEIRSVRQTRLNRASVHLEALSPLAVLSRGYALVYAADGTLLRSVADVAAGETIRARLARGMLEASVTQTTIDEVKVTEIKNS